MSKELEIAKQAARQAGKLLLARFGKKTTSYHKYDLSYVTDADIQSQKIIKNILKRYTPSYNIISEESEKEDRGSEYTWYVDPLDGTHNFMHNMPEFGVSIGLAKKTEVVAGVIFIPVLNLMFYAEKGTGAYLNGKRIHVSSRNAAQRYVMMIELDSAVRDSTFKFLKTMEREKNRLRAFASAVYSLGNLASGNLDAYITFRTHPWDIAAAMIIVKEAGGKFAKLNGKKASINDSRVLVSNGKVHKHILSLLEKANL